MAVLRGKDTAAEILENLDRLAFSVLIACVDAPSNEGPWLAPIRFAIGITMQVLILDPTPSLTKLYAAMLEGMDCTIAHSIREAEHLVTQYGLPAVLIIERRIARPGDIGWDIDGPLDGDEYVDRLVDRQPDLPVVFVAAIDTTGLSDRRHQVLLQKPFDGITLQLAVQRAIVG